MAAQGSRTLKLSILADVSNLTKNLKTGTKETQGFADDLTDFSKKAAAAFLVAGTAAAAFAVVAVKAAAEDEAAAKRLADTLKATTGATDAQTAAVEEWISQTSIAIGVTDDDLRPALGRLARSTGDTESAQKLLNLALDISSATGKPLEGVANALGRAYDGNTTALGKLGLGLDATTLKSKPVDDIFKDLTTTFGGFAEGAATTTEGRFKSITIAMDEAKEEIGLALLPMVAKLTSFIITYAVPGLNAFIKGMTGKGGLAEGATDTQIKLYNMGQQVLKLIRIIWSMKEELLILGAVMAAVFVVGKINAFVLGGIAAIKGLIAVYNALKASAILAGVAAYFALNPLAGVAASAIIGGLLYGATKLIEGTNPNIPEVGNLPTGGGGGFTFTPPKTGTLNLPSGDLFTGGGGGTAAGGTGTFKDYFTLLEAQSLSTRMTENMNANLVNIAQSQFGKGMSRSEIAQGLVTNYFTINGALDAESTARQIVDILNQAQARGTLGAGALVP